MISCRQPAMSLQRKRLSIIICQSEEKKRTVISERFIMKSQPVKQRLQNACIPTAGGCLVPAGGINRRLLGERTGWRNKKTKMWTILSAAMKVIAGPQGMKYSV